jgi:hypothetical protein
MDRRVPPGDPTSATGNESRMPCRIAVMTLAGVRAPFLVSIELR